MVGRVALSHAVQLHGGVPQENRFDGHDREVEASGCLKRSDEGSDSKVWRAVQWNAGACNPARDRRAAADLSFSARAHGVCAGRRTGGIRSGGREFSRAGVQAAGNRAAGCGDSACIERAADHADRPGRGTGEAAATVLDLVDRAGGGDFSRRGDSAVYLVGAGALMARGWWWLQRITGALLVILLIAHFWVEHFVSE